MRHLTIPVSSPKAKPDAIKDDAPACGDLHRRPCYSPFSLHGRREPERWDRPLRTSRRQHPSLEGIRWLQVAIGRIPSRIRMRRLEISIDVHAFSAAHRQSPSCVDFYAKPRRGWRTDDRKSRRNFRRSDLPGNRTETQGAARRPIDLEGRTDDLERTGRSAKFREFHSPSILERRFHRLPGVSRKASSGQRQPSVVRKQGPIAPSSIPGYENGATGFSDCAFSSNSRMASKFVSDAFAPYFLPPGFPAEGFAAASVAAAFAALAAPAFWASTFSLLGCFLSCFLMTLSPTMRLLCGRVRHRATRYPTMYHIQSGRGRFT